MTNYLSNISSPADLKRLTPDQLQLLAEELRSEIIGAVCETGGHLASNLGTVELTIALHYVFDTPSDKLIWDVSHQCYSHKALTGRREKLHTLRQYHGLAGYCKRAESEYDHFGAGHASTSISAALGFAVARDLAGETNKVVAIIGDGAMTGGLAFEAMNNAGAMKSNLLVVLNDNTWSISKNVGALSTYMTSIMADEKMVKLRAEIWDLVGRFKRREQIRETIRRMESSIKGFLVPGMLFEKLGFKYFGPIDGHDLPLLTKTLRDMKDIPGPVMLHIGTIKGKGYNPAEADAFKYHGVSKFDKITGTMDKSAAGFPSYTKIFGDTMVELADRNKSVVAITAAMSSGTGLVAYGEKHPDRFFDVGIAEAHASCFAAGLACEGIKPYVAIYSTFLQRAYDQIVHDMAIQSLPVTICMDRAGLVGNDGPTHHGMFDIPYLSAIPNLTLAAPKDGNELRSMMYHTCDHDLPGIVAIRYPRDNSPVAITAEVAPIVWGTWEWLTKPSDIVILATGSLVYSALEVAKRLHEKGIELSVINARFIKPFDQELLSQVTRDSRVLFTAEEGTIRGGFGQAIADYLLSVGYTGRFKSIAAPDRFVTHGDREQLLAEVGLDVSGMLRTVEETVAQSPVSESKPTGGFFSKLIFRSAEAIKKRDPQRPLAPTGTDTR